MEYIVIFSLSIGIACLIILITIKRVKKEYDKLLFIDSTTGLKNQKALYADISEYKVNSVVMLDIVCFSRINDIYGRRVGDKILVKLTKILKHNTKGRYRIYRFQNDKFIALHKDDHIDTFETLKIKKDLEKITNSKISFKLDGEVFEVDIEFRAVIVNNQDSSMLIEKADMSMKYAKLNHLGLVTYSKDLNLEDNINNDLKMIKIVKNALDKDQIIPYFQKISSDKETNYYESLARIEHNGSIINPDKFIKIIKKTSYSTKLAKTMLDKSIEFFEHRDEYFSINLSYIDIKCPDFIDYLVDKLESISCTERITFEILESEDIKDYNIINSFILVVREFGSKVAIDDFGSGYSNYKYLGQFHPDYLKIDGSLIMYIDKDVTSVSIVKSIVSFAKSMGIKTIAEYVHTKEVYEKAIELNIDYFQGYYIAKPSKDIK